MTSLTARELYLHRCQLCPDPILRGHATACGQVEIAGWPWGAADSVPSFRQTLVGVVGSFGFYQRGSFLVGGR